MSTTANSEITAGLSRIPLKPARYVRPMLLQPHEVFTGIAIGLESCFRIVARSMTRRIETVADTVAERQIRQRLQGARKLVRLEVASQSRENTPSIPAKASDRARLISTREGAIALTP